jgi:hypothetical protein
MKQLFIMLLFSVFVFMIVFTVFRYLEIYNTTLDWFLITICALTVFVDGKNRTDLIRGVFLALVVSIINFINSFFIMAFLFKDGI